MTDPIDPKPAPAGADLGKPAKPDAKPAKAPKAPKAPLPPLDPRAKRMMRIGTVMTVLGALALLFSMFMWWGGSVRDNIGYAFNGWRPGVTTTKSGLQYEVLKKGEGKNPTDTDVALVTYDGKLLNGTSFDKSAQPTPMPIKGVVPGFAEALKLMNKGEKIRVWIPAKLAYGADEKKDQAGTVVIPANSVLVFDLELLEFLPQSVIDQYQQQMMNQMGGAGGAGGPPGGSGGPPGAGGPPAPGGAPDPAPTPAPAPKGK